MRTATCSGWNVRSTPAGTVRTAAAAVRTEARARGATRSLRRSASARAKSALGRGARASLARVLASIAGVWVALACAACAGGTGQGAGRDAADETVAPIIARADQRRADGDFDGAIAAYTVAFERTPWNTRLRRAIAVTHTEKAAIARESGQLTTAEAGLRAALALYPDEVEFKRNLGAVLVDRAQLERDDAARAELIAQARQLSPELGLPDQVLYAPLERQLDLAYQLLEDGKTETGTAELERICRDFPDDVGARRLLAQAKVRLASELSDRGNFVGAAAALDGAVGLYAELPPCEDATCDPDAPRVAHYNRVIVLINAGERDRARRALAEAQARGFSLGQLESAIDGRN